VPNRPEAILLDLFQELLNSDQIGVDDSFLEFESDSITVLKLVSRARDAGLAVSIADVFECRTVARLARRAQEQADGSEPADGPEAEPPRSARASTALIEMSRDEIEELEAGLSGRA
jgi:aryl carrier-like protein